MYFHSKENTLYIQILILITSVYMYMAHANKNIDLIWTDVLNNFRQEIQLNTKLYEPLSTDLVDTVKIFENRLIEY